MIWIQMADENVLIQREGDYICGFWNTLSFFLFFLMCQWKVSCPSSFHAPSLLRGSKANPLRSMNIKEGKQKQKEGRQIDTATAAPLSPRRWPSSFPSDVIIENTASVWVQVLSQWRHLCVVVEKEHSGSIQQKSYFQRSAYSKRLIILSRHSLNNRIKENPILRPRSVVLLILLLEIILNVTLPRNGCKRCTNAKQHSNSIHQRSTQVLLSCLCPLSPEVKVGWNKAVFWHLWLISI